MFLLFFDFYRKAYRTPAPQNDKKNGDVKAINGGSKAINGNGKFNGKTNGIPGSPRARTVGGIKQS